MATAIATRGVPTPPAEHQYEMRDDAISRLPPVGRTARRDSNDIWISAKLKR